jgi:hypothetical protein
MKILNKIDAFERYFTLLFYKIEKALFPESKKVKTIKEKVEERTKHYEWLIEQYQAIKEKRSLLSAQKRKEVQEQVEFLISKGHIKINQ